MPAKPGGYRDLLAIELGPGWTHPQGEPEGVSEFILNRHADDSYTHLLRVKQGTVFPEPILHEFYEEAYYVHGEMLNTKTKKRIKDGAYVFHKPGEEHGPFRCLKTTSRSPRRVPASWPTQFQGGGAMNAAIFLGVECEFAFLANSTDYSILSCFSKLCLTQSS